MTSPHNTSMSEGGSSQLDASHAIQMVITVLIFLVGIPLNVLVVWVLGLRRGWRGNGGEARGASCFRTYVVNLALADLVLLLRTPLMLGYLAHGGSWPFGLTACQLIMFLRGLGLYANAFLLCAISVERCLCLMRPVWFRLRRPGWSVTLVCVFLWLLAVGLSAPYISTAALVPVRNNSQCLESKDFLKGQTCLLGLFITESILGFLLPLLLFLSSNLAVVLGARKVGEAVNKSPSAPTSPTSPTSPSSSPSFVRLYRVLFLTMILFLTCWVPYFIFRFILRLVPNSPRWENLQKASQLGSYCSLYLVYLKSALNPVLYVFASRGLRRTVRVSVLSTVERIFYDETSDYSRRKSLRRKDSQF